MKKIGYILVGLLFLQECAIARENPAVPLAASAPSVLLNLETQIDNFLEIIPEFSVAMKKTKQAYINRLDTLKAEFLKKNRDMDQENRDIDQENRDMDQENRDIDQENRDMEQKNRDIDQENRDMEQKKQEMEQKNQEMKRKFEWIGDVHNALNNELRQLRNQISELVLLSPESYKENLENIKNQVESLLAALEKLGGIKLYKGARKKLVNPWEWAALEERWKELNSSWTLRINAIKGTVEVLHTLLINHCNLSSIDV